MYYLIRVLLVLILKNLVASQSDEEIFADSRLSLQRTIQIIMLDGQVDNNCTLRNSNEKTEKRLTDVKWKWTRNGTVLVNKSDKFEIISNEFSSRLVKRAANFSDTGLYACIASFGQLEEKNIDFKLIVIDKLYAVWIFLGSASLCLVICICIFIYENLVNRRKSSSRRRADESFAQN